MSSDGDTEATEVLDEQGLPGGAPASAAVTQVRSRTGRARKRSPTVDTAVLSETGSSEPAARKDRPSRTVSGGGPHAHAKVGDAPGALLRLPGERPFDIASAKRDGMYFLGPVIGEGGMGVVVEALHQDLLRTVALKTLKEENKNEPGMIQALLFEARITGQLEHPHIVPVHDVGTLKDGRVFYTMKLVGHLSLRDVLVQLNNGNDFAVQTYTLNRLLLYFRGICHAMEYAHARGVIHRDLKPDNVLIGEYGEVQIMDWGIARVLPHGPDKPGLFAGAPEEPGLVAGTPHYMSPEQAAGAVQLVDARSDVYSLGVMLYQILTLELPFGATTTREQMDQVLTQPLPPPSEKAPHRDIPPELEAICMRALARDRAERYESAIDMWHDIEAFLEGRREQERLTQLAEEQTVRAQTALDGYQKLHEQVAELEAVVEDERRLQGYFDPLNVRMERWDRELRADHLRLTRARAFSDAVAGFNRALAYQSRFGPALDGLARLYRHKSDEAYAVDWETMVLYGDLALAADTRAGTDEAGTLNVRSYPEGATIRLYELGGSDRLDPAKARDLGIAPCTDVRVKAGSYLISASLPGFKEKRSPLVIAPGEKQSELLVLHPWSATVPLIGRSEEIQAIKQSFDAASAEGKLHMMLVCGEAGLGKRKLLADFDEYLGLLPFLVLHAFVEAEPNDRYVPFGAAARLLRYRFAVGLHDTPSSARQRIRAFVVHALTHWGTIEVTPELDARIDEVMERIARIPGVADGGIEEPQTREETLGIFQAVTDVFMHVSAIHPVVLAIHGAGHLDRLSRDLFEYMAVHLLDRPIFCLAMSRTPTIPLQTPNTMQLRPLDLEGVQHQINILLKGRPSTELLDLIFRKAGGNPFQITEFVRFLHISGLLVRQKGRWSVDYDNPKTRELDTMSVEDVTLMELRTLSSTAIDVLDSAAICGRAFWRGQVASMVGHDVDGELVALVEHEVLVQQPFSRFQGEWEYAFRSHAMQAVLYRRLPEEARRSGHLKAAAWLSSVSSGALPDKARMAQHLQAAGDEDGAEACRRALSDHAALWEGDDAPGWYDWPQDSSSALLEKRPLEVIEAREG